jgi:hypothetical protein
VRRLISGQVPCIHSGPSHRGYPPWDSNPDDARSERAGSAVGLEGHGAADRVRTGDPNVGNVVLYLLSYNRMEPAPRVELGPPPYHSGVLPLSPSRRSWDAWIRTTTTAFKARRPAVSRHPIESLLPVSNRHLARYRRAGACPVALGRAERCARRDSNPQRPASRAGLSARLEYEHIRASARTRTADPAVTKGVL